MDKPQREHRARGRAGVWVAGASLAAVVSASACCIGPLVLSTVGVSALGVSAAFAPARPYFLGVTALLLGVSFYDAYFRKPTCEPGAACTVKYSTLTRMNQGLLWFAVTAVIIVALFPTYAGSLFAGSTALAGSESAAGASTVTLQVEGMTCGACTVSIQQALVRVPGVQTASVSYKEGKAIVAVDRASTPSIPSLVQAIEQTGYTARPAPGDH